MVYMVACGAQVQSYMFIVCTVISVVVCEHTHVSRKVFSGVANKG